MGDMASTDKQTNKHTNRQPLTCSFFLESIVFLAVTATATITAVAVAFVAVSVVFAIFSVVFSPQLVGLVACCIGVNNWCGWVGGWVGVRGWGGVESGELNGQTQRDEQQ